jgi:aspartyl-tRNA(Asn)/glutamyl-tRNA(Gln) amidotransferase subunit A
MNRRDIVLAAGIGALHPRLYLRAKETGGVSGDPAELTLAEAASAVRDGTVTSRDLTLACFDRIAVENPRINALVTVMRESALAQAAVLDAEARAKKFRSPLHGIPIAVKDAIDTAGTRTTAGSALFENRVPREDAHVVRLLRQAGAVILAKSNLSEFSLTATDATSHFGPVHNPWVLDRVSGGSSGGSAAAVATRMCFAALGTDSGGSVRIPSAWCADVGLKPTEGLVSNRGIIPSVSILDTCGPIARRVEDVAIMFGQMVGYDALDIRSVDRPAEDYALSVRQSVSHLRIGIPRKPYFDDLDSQTATCMEEALRVIAGLTRGIEDVTLRPVAELLDGFINVAEIYSYHQKMMEQPAELDLYMPGTRKVLQGCVQDIENSATGTTAAKLARYIQSVARLERHRRTVDATFTDFDLLVLPTLKDSPPTIQAALHAEGTARAKPLFSIENTLVFNALGLPALTVPCGFCSEGWPIGLMIGGPRFSEGRLLALAAAYEQSTKWHERLPPRAA